MRWFGVPEFSKILAAIARWMPTKASINSSTSASGAFNTAHARWTAGTKCIHTCSSSDSMQARYTPSLFSK